MNEILLERWLDYLTGTGRSEATMTQYRSALERIIKGWGKDPKHPPESQSWLHATMGDLELVTGILAHKNGLTPRSRRPLVAAVKSFYKWAHRAGQIEDNPAARLQYPKAGRPLPVAMSLGSATKLFMAPDVDTFRGLRDAAMFAVLAGCGLRISGLVRMDQEDLIWDRSDGYERLYLRVIEKGDRHRIMPVPYEAALLIRAYLGHEELARIARDTDRRRRVMWVSLRNQRIPAHKFHGEARRIKASSVYNIIQGYGEQSGIPPGERHPHALRHLYGAELAEADIDVLRSQALMGHATSSSTEIYRHLALRKLTEAVDRANPLRKIKAPIFEELRKLAKRVNQ